MREALQIEFVAQGVGVWPVKSHAVPAVGEVIQILGDDYTVARRFWAVDDANDPRFTTLRAIVELEPPAHQASEREKP